MVRPEAAEQIPYRRGAAAALVLLAAYLLWPALTATHVEGFTAALQTDAIAAHRHLIDRADLLYPAQTEYLYLTRQGVVLLLRGLMQWTGTTGDALFRVLTVASLVVFLGSTAIVARRHAGKDAGGWTVTLASLILLPGLFELGFYFSDGVVAVACGMAGLACMPPGVDGRPPLSWWARGLASGLALGLAALCRPDALLLLPLGLGLAWLDQRDVRRLALLAVVAAAGLLGAFALGQLLSGTSFVDAVRIGRDFDRLHAGMRILWMRALVLLMFFGLAGLAFVAFGAVLAFRRETTKRRIALLGLPGLLMLYAAHSATEVRQIWPYAAPFVVLLCSRGIVGTFAALHASKPMRRSAAALLVGTVLVWLLPPVFVPIKDGPRAMFGRIWSPPLWRAWQGRVDASLDDVDALVVEAERQPRIAVISAHFNSDHYLQLRAWQRGWTPRRVDETIDRCGGGVEVWQKGAHTLLQIRLDNTYGLSQVDSEDYIALHLHEALACRTLRDVPTYFTDFWPFLSKKPIAVTMRDALPLDPPMGRSFGWPAFTAPPLIHVWRHREFWVPLQYGINRTVLLPPQTLQRARDLADRRVTEPATPPGVGPLPRMADLAPRFGTRYWTPPASASVDERPAD